MRTMRTMMRMMRMTMLDNGSGGGGRGGNGRNNANNPMLVFRQSDSRNSTRSTRNVELQEYHSGLPVVPAERTLAAVGQRDNTTPVKLAELFYGESCLEAAYSIVSSELHHLLDPSVQGPDVLLG
jgi:hypothetical protein